MINEIERKAEYLEGRNLRVYLCMEPEQGRIHWCERKRQCNWWDDELADKISLRRGR